VESAQQALSHLRVADERTYGRVRFTFFGRNAKSGITAP
jgi:hypothetical protein